MNKRMTPHHADATHFLFSHANQSSFFLFCPVLASWPGGALLEGDI